MSYLFKNRVMAKNTNNNATFGMSGRVNQFVFRQRFGKTVVAKLPVRTAPLTESQKIVNSTFKKAVLYARTILQDEAIRLAYGKKMIPGQTTHNIAIADFFKAPEILSVDILGVNDPSGSKIIVMAIDNFRVEVVKIQIEKADGTVVEEGNAILQNEGLNWVYYTTVENANTSGNKIRVTAIDLPGNKTVEEKII